MKKIIAISAFLLAALTAGAQSMYDAMMFSQNNYYGTARTIALGNAVTALGGDLGTIGINPAGSAVSDFGQVELTPSLTLSSAGAQFSPIGDKQFGSSTGTTSTKFGLPNGGISLYFDTGADTGLRGMSFAFVWNRTNSFQNGFSAYGRNSSTSIFGEMAMAATYSGIDPSDLADYSSFYGSDLPWDMLTAYQANLYSTYGSGYDYAGNAERISTDGRYHFIPDELSQTSTVEKRGYKSDILMNFGMNFSDYVFVGFNVGMPVMDYSYTESFTEVAVNPEEFYIELPNASGTLVSANYEGGSYGYRYAADVSGIYAKLGLIVLPTDHLRLGAAIQTPTLYTIRETCQYLAASSYSNSSLSQDASSPVNEYTYNLRSPYVADFGVAYTIGTAGLVSVDYEIADYSVMKFSDTSHDAWSDDSFSQVNEVNSKFCGISRSLRLGAELRLTDLLSVRAGYSMTTSPERHWTNSLGQDVLADDYLADFSKYHGNIITLSDPQYFSEDTMRSFSAGFGYSSFGSFFADFAVRCNVYPTTYFSPYYNYDNWNASGTAVNVDSPRMKVDRKLWDAVLTFGWRF